MPKAQEEDSFRRNALRKQNKMRRAKAYVQELKQKSKEKRTLREKRKKEREILGEDAPPKMEPKTIENMRVFDHTVVNPDDEEVMKDEAIDEFEDFFSNKSEPNVLVTTTQRASKENHHFIDELMDAFPKSTKLKRNQSTVREMIEFAKSKEFTDLIVVNDDGKDPNGLIVVHLPAGPTALFSLSNIELRQNIANCGNPSGEKPELILEHFDTRLGHTLGRMFASLFCVDPEFRGRRVVTFYNSRDFIFFRSHRYVFAGAEDDVRVRLQETGPRFCLRLKWIQKGCWEKDPQYLWKEKKELKEGQRRKFHL